MRLVLCLLAPAAWLACTAAQADVVISTKPTENMTCSNGVCSPTAPNAVLNAGDLQNMLASGNITVTTTGNGAQANNIDVIAPFGWSATNALSLDAFQSVLVKNSISVSGSGGLSVTTNDGGTDGYFGFRGKGHVTFADLSDKLTINSVDFVLVGDIATLAADIAANPNGSFALANNYDASKDGRYRNSAVPTIFGGSFEGLGNAISGLSIKVNAQSGANGLFAGLSSGGLIENIVVRKLSISGNGFAIGGLVGTSSGTIAGAKISGTIKPVTGAFGLLAGVSYGTIIRSSATGTIASSSPVMGGCLVGSNIASIIHSFANCTLSGGKKSKLGGLVGQNDGSIIQCYASGAVSGGDLAEVGGLVGQIGEGGIAQAYSTAAVEGTGVGKHLGGLIGADFSRNNDSTYWDTTTSGVTDPGQGAGKPKNDPGITGLTTEQLQSGLPKGFDSSIWAEDPKINNGLPYLIDNPPEK